MLLSSPGQEPRSKSAMTIQSSRPMSSSLVNVLSRCTALAYATLVRPVTSVYSTRTDSLFQICTSRRTTGRSPVSRSRLPYRPRFQPTNSPPSPLIGGHEGVGDIVAIGEHTQDSPVKIGDRVGIKWLAYSCLQCEFVRFFSSSQKPLPLFIISILRSVVRA